MSKHRLSHRVLVFFAEFLDDKVGWDKLPTLSGILTLVGLRKRLREHNLFDAGVGPVKAELADPRWLRARSPNGTYNDLDEPAMGARGVRFGRNIPLERTYPQTEPRYYSPARVWSAQDCSPENGLSRPAARMRSSPHGCSSRFTTGSATERI